MQLLIEDSEKEAFRSTSDDRPARLPEFQQGDTIPLSVGLLKRITNLYDSRIFTPQVISTWAVRATIETEVVADLETDSPAPSASVAVVTQGDATHNHVVRVTLPATRWGGSWTFTSASVESGVIGYDDDPALVEDILEAVSTIGAGNVTVTRETDDTYLVAYKGTKALMAIAGIAVNGAALKVLSLKSGTMDLRTVGIAALFADDPGIDQVVKFTVLGIPAAGTEQVLLQRDVVLRAFEGEYEVSDPIDILGTIYLSTITDFTGGAATDLDGVRTVGRQVGTIFRVVVEISGTPILSEWRLQAGVAVTDLAAGVIRPIDYHADDNPVNLVLVSGTAI